MDWNSKYSLFLSWQIFIYPVLLALVDSMGPIVLLCDSQKNYRNWLKVNISHWEYGDPIYGSFLPEICCSLFSSFWIFISCFPASGLKVSSGFVLLLSYSWDPCLGFRIVEKSPGFFPYYVWISFQFWPVVCIFHPELVTFTCGWIGTIEAVPILNH